MTGFISINNNNNQHDISDIKKMYSSIESGRNNKAIVIFQNDVKINDFFSRTDYISYYDSNN